MGNLNPTHVSWCLQAQFLLPWALRGVLTFEGLGAPCNNSREIYKSLQATPPQISLALRCRAPREASLNPTGLIKARGGRR